MFDFAAIPTDRLTASVELHRYFPVYLLKFYKNGYNSKALVKNYRQRLNHARRVEEWGKMLHPKVVNVVDASLLQK